MAATLLAKKKSLLVYPAAGVVPSFASRFRVAFKHEPNTQFGGIQDEQRAYAWAAALGRGDKATNENLYCSDAR
jgi:primosomal protein N'